MSLAIMGVSSLVICYTKSLLVFSMMFFCIGVAGNILGVLIQLAILSMYTEKSVEIWIKTMHFSFGVGAFISPLIITIFKLSSFKIYAFFCILFACFYLLKENPFARNPGPRESVTLEDGLKAIPLRMEYLLIAFFYCYSGC
jgi:hypothetical protein